MRRDVLVVSFGIRKAEGDFDRDQPDFFGFLQVVEHELHPVFVDDELVVLLDRKVPLIVEVASYIMRLEYTPAVVIDVGLADSDVKLQHELALDLQTWVPLLILGRRSPL